MKISWLPTIAAAAVLGTAIRAAFFTTVVLITGPLWAKPIWGTYWAWWDVRLVSTLFLWFIYAACVLSLYIRRKRVRLGK